MNIVLFFVVWKWILVYVKKVDFLLFCFKKRRINVLCFFEDNRDFFIVNNFLFVLSGS